MELARALFKYLGLHLFILFEFDVSLVFIKFLSQKVKVLLEDLLHLFEVSNFKNVVFK